jgi:hypothetical protein
VLFQPLYYSAQEGHYAFVEVQPFEPLYLGRFSVATFFILQKMSVDFSNGKFSLTFVNVA